LQIIFTSKPNLHTAVIAAYATASAEGKHVIETVVEETDPSFLTRLKKRTSLIRELERCPKKGRTIGSRTRILTGHSGARYAPWQRRC
jgi:hypothetical protein